MTKIRTVAKYVFLTIVSLISVFPLYWMAVSATHASIDVIRGALLPGNYLFKNLSNLLGASDVSGAMINSFKYSIMMTILALFICSLADTVLKSIMIRQRTLLWLYFCWL